MKRYALAFTAFVLLCATLGAQTVPGFSMMDARSLGMGGSFVAVSEGYRSLYGNPAGLASPKAELTLLGPSFWVYLRPESDSVDELQSAVKDSDTDALQSLLADNGFGAGLSLGLGYAGKGFGIGAFVTQDAYAQRQSAPDVDSVSADTDFQANLVLGGAFPVEFLGAKLTMGVDLRPFFHAVGASLSLTDLVASLDSGSLSAFLRQDATGGFGLAADVGVTLRAGAFTLGAVIRDIAPAFSVNSGTLRELLGSWGAGSDAGTFTLDPAASVGIQFHPDLGGLSEYADPRILVEMQDLLALMDGDATVLESLHAGAEIKMLNFLVFRAGLNSGYVTMGAGLDLLYLELNAAAFAQAFESESSGRSGIIVEAAVRL